MASGGLRERNPYFAAGGNKSPQIPGGGPPKQPQDMFSRQLHRNSLVPINEHSIRQEFDLVSMPAPKMIAMDDPSLSVTTNSRRRVNAKTMNYKAHQQMYDADHHNNFFRYHGTILPKVRRSRALYLFPRHTPTQWVFGGGARSHPPRGGAAPRHALMRPTRAPACADATEPSPRHHRERGAVSATNNHVCALHNNCMHIYIYKYIYIFAYEC